MTDILLSGFLSLFALLGKKKGVDGAWAETMLVSYLRHHFAIRKIDTYLGYYNDLRETYEMMDDEQLDTQAIINDICSSLHGRVQTSEESLLLLRLMEFCNYQEELDNDLFGIIVEKLHIPEEQFRNFIDYVSNKPTKFVMMHKLKDSGGQLKTLLDPHLEMLLFTYMGEDKITLNDVPVIPGIFQVWIQSSVLKGQEGKPIYFSTILDEYTKANGGHNEHSGTVEFCGRDINFHYPGSEIGTHNLSFNLCSGEMLAIMGGSGTGKSTILSILNGTRIPQEGKITINGHDISEPEAKSLIGFVPQDDLLIEELTVYQNLWFTAKLCFAGMSDEEIDQRVMKTLKDLGVDAAKDLKVGSPINNYISGGQRKRLNIALELIREPAVLFLDEPTSGLSSADTEKVINLLKEQT